MFRIKALFPCIGLFKIPLNVYEQLKQQLDEVFEELRSYLELSKASYRISDSGIEIEVSDFEKAVDTLAKLHSSFTIVHSVQSEVKGDYREYLENLTNRFSIVYPSILNEMAGLIESRMYSKAYSSALKGLLEVSRAEILYAKTGRFVEQSVFNMLYGNIPQVYVETYILVEKGSRYAESIAEEIYSSVSKEAREASLAIGSRGKFWFKKSRL